MMHSSMYEQRSVSPATYALRCAIVVTMIAAVATLLHLSHYSPKQTFLSCDRPCHHLDWPMICRVKLTLEVYQSLSRSCGDCPANETACHAEHCISADGHKRGLLTANRQIPGSSIQVCENDILVVDVVNRLPGGAAAIHWRGQPQTETPCMDGAPLVTQCPIPSYTTFQYKFRAAAPGTHLWHAHAGSDVVDGIFGSLIVRQPDLREPHRALYDIDDPNHVILITEWQHSFPSHATSRSQQSTASLLVNGKGREPGGPKVPLSTFTVVPGRRHRFRIAHAGGAGSCPLTISVDDHPILLIALDGQPVNPQQVNSITLVKGERMDFILKANKAIHSYRLKVETAKECVSPFVSGMAIVRYKGSPKVEPSAIRENVIITDVAGTEDRKIAFTTNSDEECEIHGKLCITEIQAMLKMPKSLAKEKMDVKMYLPINYSIQSSDFLGGGEIHSRVLHVGNATFTFPSSPLLTQGGDVPPSVFCSDEGGDDISPEARCRQDTANESHVCECVHVRRIPLGATVELILLDQGGIDDLVYHLHGYSFHVVGVRQLSRSMSLDEVKELDSRGALFTRNLDCAPSKDTVAVPKYGVVALRFKADNPGYWMLRDEHAPQWTRGLDVVLQACSCVALPVMSCVSALDLQLVTFLSVPHEVLFLQHKVFREYAKIAVGPDFIHTLPSFIVLAAMGIILWKKPPKLKWLSALVNKMSVFRMFQISASWVTVNAVLWLWLIFQRILYCYVWSYWSYDSEHRDISYAWWQRVWSSYYPPPMQPPVFSAGFISWLLSMAVAITILGYATAADRMRCFLINGLTVLQDVLQVARCYVHWSTGRLREVIACERGMVLDESEVSSICDDCRSELSTDVMHGTSRPEIHPISYGTNWTPRPSFSGFKEAQRKFSTKPLRTPVTVTGGIDHHDDDRISPRQLRHRRGCHTVIPSNSSDKSSGC